MYTFHMAFTNPSVELADAYADSALPAFEICEVAPRDGLQNESSLLSTSQKVELVSRVVAAGARRIEVTSFVSPRHVPAMADAEAVVEATRDRHPEVAFSALVLNQRGLDRAIAAGITEVNMAVVTTDTFSRRNQGMSTDQAVQVWQEIALAASEAGLRTTVTIAAAFGCPFEGEVPVARVVDLAAALCESSPDELALADTIGVAVPRDISRLVHAVSLNRSIPLRLHLHDTRNTGVANALAGLAAGVSTLDASLGGFGGCPFAPAATGNLATEDLVYAAERSGTATSFDLPSLISAARWLGERLGKDVPSSVTKAGIFPDIHTKECS